MEDSLLSRFSKEERKIQACFDSIKFKCGDAKCEREQERACLSGTSYSSKRKPSSAMAAAKMSMIQSNAWLFESQVNLMMTYDILDGLRRARRKILSMLSKVKKATEQAVHGRGIAVQGGAYFGIGSSWLGEVILHDKKVALFCAPGTMINTDIGVELGVVGVSTLSCDSNSEYSGSFLSLGISASGEVFLIPASAQLSYSLGFDSRRFRKELDQFLKQKYTAQQVIQEFNYLSRAEDFREPSKKFAIHSLGHFLNFIFPFSANKAVAPIDELSFNTNNLVSRKNSLGDMAKSFFKSSRFKALLRKYNLKALEQISRIISESYTGCDSIAGAASISLSAMPASVSIQHSYYTKLLEAKLGVLDSLTELSAFKLANPFLLDFDTLGAVVDFAELAVRAPSKLSQCRRSQRQDLQLILKSQL